MRPGTRPLRRARLQARLHRLPLNFDPSQHDVHKPESGWDVDDRRQPLPPEPPGPPGAPP